MTSKTTTKQTEKTTAKTTAPTVEQTAADAADQIGAETRKTVEQGTETVRQGLETAAKETLEPLGKRFTVAVDMVKDTRG